MQNVYLQRIMKKNADKGYEKTNPIKPCPERSRMGQFQRQKKSRYLVISFLEKKCRIKAEYQVNRISMYQDIRRSG